MCHILISWNAGAALPLEDQPGTQCCTTGVVRITRMQGEPAGSHARALLTVEDLRKMLRHGARNRAAKQAQLQPTALGYVVGAEVHL